MQAYTGQNRVSSLFLVTLQPGALAVKAAVLKGIDNILDNTEYMFVCYADDTQVCVSMKSDLLLNIQTCLEEKEDISFNKPIL